MSQTALMPVTHRNPSTTCTPAAGSQDQIPLPQAYRNHSIKEKGEIGGVSVDFFFNKATFSYFLHFSALLHTPAAGFCQGAAPC